MAQGISNYRACREIRVHPTTGMRWRDGRKMADSGGLARYYPPIAAPPVVISARFLSEDERVLIGDLPSRCLSLNPSPVSADTHCLHLLIRRAGHL